MVGDQQLNGQLLWSVCVMAVNLTLAIQWVLHYSNQSSTRSRLILAFDDSTQDPPQLSKTSKMIEASRHDTVHMRLHVELAVEQDTEIPDTADRTPLTWTPHTRMYDFGWTNKLLFFDKHNFCVQPYVPREPRRDPSNRRLNGHEIYIRHCEESNSQPVPSQAGSDSTRPQWRTNLIFHGWPEPELCYVLQLIPCHMTVYTLHHSLPSGCLYHISVTSVEYIHWPLLLHCCFAAADAILFPPLLLKLSMFLSRLVLLPPRHCYAV